MKWVKLAVVAVVPVMLVACGPGGATKQDGGAVIGAVAGGLIGNQFGKGGGRVAATMAGAVIGRSMDQTDRMLAAQAERDAFERGRSGAPVQWRNPDNGRYGEVIPDAPYRRGPRDCRDYTHRVFIDGRPQVMRGTACRNPDGTWSSVG